MNPATAMTTFEYLDAIIKYGPWALLLGALKAIHWMFFEMRRRDLEHAKEMKELMIDSGNKSQELNDRLVSTVEKQIPLLQAQNQQTDQLVRAISQMTREDQK